MAKSKYLGLVLAQKKLEIEKHLRALNLIAEKVNEFAIHYEKLGLGSFNAEVLLDIEQNKIKNIEEKYYQICDDAIMKAGLTMHSFIEIQKRDARYVIRQAELVMKTIFKALDDERYSHSSAMWLGGEIALEISQLNVQAGRATVDKIVEQRIASMHQIRIETQEQEEAYLLFLDAKKALQAFFENVKAYSGSSPCFAFIGEPWSGALIDYDNNGDVELNPELIKVMRPNQPPSMASKR
jgi:hypothetical protein